MDRHLSAGLRVHGATILAWERHLPLSSPRPWRLLGLTPKRTTSYNPAVPRQIVAHFLGAIVTLILLAVGLAIAIPIFWLVGPKGLLVAIPFVLMGMAFWVLVWMVLKGLTTGFQFLRLWLVRVSDELKHPSSPQPPRRRVVHWFGAALTVILLVVALVIGGMGIAMAGTAFGLPAAIPFVLIGLGIWGLLAWVASRRINSLETPRRTLPPGGSETP